MAKHVGEYNGTGFTQSKKLYDYNGTSSTQIKKAYDYNGTSSTQVYSADVTLTNLLSAKVSHGQAVDAGYSDYTVDMWSGTLTQGHRYYIRANAYTGGGVFTAGGVSEVKFVDNATTQVCDRATGQIIRAVGASACKATHHWTGSCEAGASAPICTGELLMVVDITALEAMTGTLTPAQVWSYFGSAVFYGSKTISL